MSLPDSITETEMSGATALTLGTTALNFYSPNPIYYRYTPTVNCRYAFYSTDNDEAGIAPDPICAIYDATGAKIATDNDSGSGDHFCVEIILEG